MTNAEFIEMVKQDKEKNREELINKLNSNLNDFSSVNIENGSNATSLSKEKFCQCMINFNVIKFNNMLNSSKIIESKDIVETLNSIEGYIGIMKSIIEKT